MICVIVKTGFGINTAVVPAPVEMFYFNDALLAL